MPSLFEKVVDCCGLAPAFAQKVIIQACSRVGVHAETMTPAELIRALPQIHQDLSVFLDPKEVAFKTAAMRRLVQASWRSFPAVPTSERDPDLRASQERASTKSTS